ncbi:alpha-1,3-mannosyl-glycoprotein 4-beta-N-acetylglucosaminyltransferase-like protein MGAT4D isoform X6 [Lemur catta]|uniref:alpha-1,3-mannosyl-glycoprotein 4-beta-N-acetylglucosaminyltransferase-like protein MGAT4D isoform X6 n=1 Tax=Lemur catta TaxID=9447 RepID=UPI001E26AA82|nr:alpha-1,3-mannosyl-glycoprotein 4-beta-N-acetylglucosaminyltransferase-like protein MGAT4D isoform X6 [Lemur catta]
MKTKHVNLLIALVVAVLFSFSCFCISRLTQTNNQFINCRNHILEFEDNILRLKSKTERNSEELMKALKQMKYEITQRENLSVNLVEKKVSTLSKNEAVPDTFEDLKFFIPHLRKEGRIYPDVVIGKGKTGVSFALGIPTINRGNYTYLKQTLTSVVSRMTPSEEKDSVVIVSISDIQKASEVWFLRGHFNTCVFLYKHIKCQTINRGLTKETELASQTSIGFLRFDAVCPTQGQVLFTGKLFRSEDLPDFVRFFLMFYKEKPIDWLLEDMFQVKMCYPGEPLMNYKGRRKQIRIQYKPSLFQHVGKHSSFSGREQHYKVRFLTCNFSNIQCFTNL